ncbi:MAG: hypothetical protein UH734_08270 [Ruminococcus sp.]|nr:hypothetical protein [Ruminococcus sp.]
MKKALALIMAIVLVFSLAACKGKQKSGEEMVETLAESSGVNWKALPREYTYGDTITVNESTGFKLDALKLKGHLHDYDDKEVPFSKDLQGLNHDFYLNESIRFYYQTNYKIAMNPGKLQILAVPHRELRNYEHTECSELISEAEKKGFVIDITSISEDEKNMGFVGENYVDVHQPAGEYDILIFNDKILCYYLVVMITAELVE